MSYLLEIKGEANLEIVEAFLYYEELQEGLGEKFLAGLEIYLEQITYNPQHFPQKRKPYREAFIKRFPFLIIYEISENKIIVYSVFNTWQNPTRKRK